VAARWVQHDRRSPAQSLTLLADLITDPDTDIEEILRESCGHLARSLDLHSRVIHPSSPADTGPISVREPLAFVAELHHAGRNRCRLELSAEPSLPAAAGIERHLEHALLNLVLNATDALEGREDGVIRIVARHDVDRIEIVVSDNGLGLAATDAGRLFESPFTTKAASHLGSGLLVAREVLRLSGATLDYLPADGPGARFVITLPPWRQVDPPPR
jgi:C4-dicarboxylate-specific signal transduction histidine kinase